MMTFEEADHAMDQGKLVRNAEMGKRYRVGKRHGSYFLVNPRTHLEVPVALTLRDTAITSWSIAS